MKVYNIATDRLNWVALSPEMKDWPGGYDTRLELTFEDLDKLYDGFKSAEVVKDHAR